MNKNRYCDYGDNNKAVIEYECDGESFAGCKDHTDNAYRDYLAKLNEASGVWKRLDDLMQERRR